MALTLFVLLAFVTSVSSKGQYVQPLNMGLQMAIPYDIANIFIRPIAGVTSVALAAGLALILFLGVITSPFGYFFGVPSRKYVLGGEPAAEPSGSRTFSRVATFGEDPFWLVPPKFNDRSCQLLIACYAHGAFKNVSKKLTKTIAFFSKSLLIDADFESAILAGLENNAKCTDLYRSCDHSVFSIIVNTFIDLLPARSRKRTETTLFA